MPILKTKIDLNFLFHKNFHESKNVNNPNIIVNTGITKLNKDDKIPLIGLGTPKSDSKKIFEAVKFAISIGYRHIDCAHIYGNETEVGAAINYKISEKVVRRDELFITSKLWNTFHKPDLVETAIKQSLKDLNLKYLNLYLMQWPMAYKENRGLFPKDPKGKILYSDVDYLDTWQAMEKLVEKDLTQSIGVSNFNIKQLERLLKKAKIKPLVHQIESHPYLDQSKMMVYLVKKGIKCAAYSPLGSPNRLVPKANEPNLLIDEKLQEIAKKYKKTVAQILIRYQLDLGNIVLPKSVTKLEIEENIRVFDFKLEPIDLLCIHSLNKNFRTEPLSEASDHKDYPFSLIYEMVFSK